MLVMDVPPKDAERFEYETLEVYPCQLIVRIRLPKPPPLPLRQMRFRCKRCGTFRSILISGTGEFPWQPAAAAV